MVDQVHFAAPSFAVLIAVAIFALRRVQDHPEDHDCGCGAVLEEERGVA